MVPDIVRGIDFTLRGLTEILRRLTLRGRKREEHYAGKGQESQQCDDDDERRASTIIGAVCW